MVIIIVFVVVIVFFCKQKTAYDMRISDWSSDVCSSDLDEAAGDHRRQRGQDRRHRMKARDQRRRGEGHQAIGDEEGRGRQERKSVAEGKRVSVSVDLGGSRNFKKKKRAHLYITNNTNQYHINKYKNNNHISTYIL